MQAGYRKGAAMALLLVGVVPAQANLASHPGFESCSTQFLSPPPVWDATSANFYCRAAGGAAHSGS
jgi:hypothetical protein